jgi:transposase
MTRPMRIEFTGALYHITSRSVRRGKRHAAGIGAYTYREIAEYFGVHLATVGRLVRRGKQQGEN